MLSKRILKQRKAFELRTRVTVLNYTNPERAGISFYVIMVNSRLAGHLAIMDTPIIQTAAKFPSKNKLQTFD